jgi:uncharacterized protein YwgA
MNRRQIALKLVLNELGMNQSMDSFDERLTLQKTIYLLQQMGVHLGYQFSWYIRGPYSRDLTADAFSNLGSELPEGWILDGKQKEKLTRAKGFLSNVAASSPKAREFEKLASVLFLVKTHQAPADNSESITARMTAAGKDFSREEVDDALRVLREHELIGI